MGTINFVLIGARNTGKTCYLAVMARHCPGITSAQDDTTHYLKTQASLLDKGELPAATASSFRELQFQYVGNGRKVNFSIDDYDGSFIESLSRDLTEDDSSRDALKRRIEECEGLMFFMPYEDDHDEKKLADFEDEFSTIVQLIEDATGGRYAILPVPVCICVTKWDRSQYYQAVDEDAHALEYINSIAPYQRTLAKLKTLFEDVHVFPISSFGSSVDGRLPIKGKVAPYHLESPIDYCLNRLFPRYEKKISELQETSDDLGLLDYLYELYDDLQHHKGGEYCQLYDALEIKLAGQLLQEIKSEKNELMKEEQLRIYNNLRREDLRTEIDKALSRFANQKKTKKNMWILLILVSVFAGAAYAYQQYEYKKEVAHNAYLQKEHEKQVAHAQVILDGLMVQIKNKDVRIDELLLRVMKERKSCLSLIGKPCKQVLNATETRSRGEFNALIVLMKESPDPKKFQELQNLLQVMDAWPNQELVQVMQQEFSNVKKSYELLQNLRSEKETVNQLDIKKYQALRNQVLKAPIQWPEMNNILVSLLQSISVQIKDDAESSMTSGGLNDLQDSIEQLSMLRDIGDKEADGILSKLIPVRNSAERKQALEQMLNAISGNLEIAKIAKEVHGRWMDGWTDEQHDRISKLLQLKFEEYESKLLPKDISFSSEEGITDSVEKFNKVNNATSTVIKEEGFSFRYQRSAPLRAQIQKWIAQRNKYQIALKDGMNLYLTFISNTDEDSEKDNPLGFNCKITNHDLILEIDGETYSDDMFGTCSEISMRLNHPIHFKVTHHIIKAIEHDLAFSDEWGPKDFRITKQNIFQVLNKGLTTIDISPYSLRLTSAQ